MNRANAYSNPVIRAKVLKNVMIPVQHVPNFGHMMGAIVGAVGMNVDMVDNARVAYALRTLEDVRIP